MGALDALRPALVAVLSAGAITGCGGSGVGPLRDLVAPRGADRAAPHADDLVARSPSEILPAARRAAQGARSVHVSGSMSSDGRPLTLDLDRVSGRGARGTMATYDFSVDVVDVADTVYLKGSRSFWQHVALQGTAQLLIGRWFKAPSNGSFAPFAHFTHLDELFSHILAGPEAMTKGPVTTIGGRRVMTLQRARSGDRLYVAATGRPYPVAFTTPGARGGVFTFTEYNHRFALVAPADAIDISQPPR